MGKINFEEYRQPWETGPHWELKREFMEKYQDDFPEDRLLCLAQAYSNIELLHCSYPDPVMLQIHELSKPLRGCKRFREASNYSSKDEPELQARSASKRSAADDLKKPFKFIKFYSVVNQSSEAADGSTTGKNTSIDAPKSNSVTEESQVPSVATPPIVLLDTNLTSTTEDNAFDNIPKSKNTEDTVAFSVTTPSTVKLDTNTTSTFKLSNSSTKNEDFILSLSQSPDFNLISKFSKALAGIKPMKAKKSKKHIKEIEGAVDLLSLHGIVKYKFEKVTLDTGTSCLCKFFIKDTLISNGRCVREGTAKCEAAAYAVDILQQLSNLPVVALSDLKSNVHKANVLFLHKFLLEATTLKRATLSSVEKVMSITDSFKCPHEVSFFYREDIESPMYTRVFYADLVINKVLICTEKSTSKRNAKSGAADQIISLLQKFFEEHPVDLQPLDSASCLSTLEHPGAQKINTDVKIDISSVVVRKNDEQKFSTHNSKFLPQMKNENSKSPLLMDPKPSLGSSSCIANPDYFKINYRLLRNSMEKQFVIFDKSEITRSQTDNPQNALFHSAQFCKKSLSFDAVYTGVSVPSGSTYTIDVTFEGENVAVGEGSTKAEARNNAGVAALKALEKQFYTIKVKSELDESFVIKRDQMMSAHVSSDHVSDNNVGCKMLKMMGWTGGGIGKTQSGITEPIMASEHRFHHGLGFADKNGDERKFRQRIESLLKEFSQTDTTSDLIFSTDFTKDERKIIHKVSLKFGLVGSSRGIDGKRQLFVKHKMTATEILNYLVRAGGRTSKYELVDRST